LADFDLCANDTGSVSPGHKSIEIGDERFRLIASEWQALINTKSRAFSLQIRLSNIMRHILTQPMKS